MRNLIFAVLILMVAACSSKSESDFVEVKVQEVYQAGNYTYLLVKGKGAAHWVAVPSMTASPGESYHYRGGLMMEGFYSEELDRTFEKVLFIESLESGVVPSDKGGEGFSYEGMVSIEKEDVSVERIEGTITIADLFSEPKKYNGKVVRIRGEVTKFNPEIMERNWVHIQDGTEHNGKFDLTATSLEHFDMGATVTLEGIITIDRDFGYGYTYEILMESAKVVE